MDHITQPNQGNSTKAKTYYTRRQCNHSWQFTAAHSANTRGCRTKRPQTETTIKPNNQISYLKNASPKRKN